MRIRMAQMSPLSSRARSLPPYKGTCQILARYGSSFTQLMRVHAVSLPSQPRPLFRQTAGLNIRAVCQDMPSLQPFSMGRVRKATHAPVRLLSA